MKAVMHHRAFCSGPHLISSTPVAQMIVGAGDDAVIAAVHARLDSEGDRHLARNSNSNERRRGVCAPSDRRLQGEGKGA